MERITGVSEADVGRVAVSKDGHFRIRILEGRDDFSKVEFLKATPAYEEGHISVGFGLIEGARTMYWEEDRSKAGQSEMDSDPIPGTVFTQWCRQNGYDPHGEFVFDKEGTSPECLNDMFSIGDVLELILDDGTSCPRFVNQNGATGFEDFNKPGRVVMKAKTAKGPAKPRFRKPRQKPAVRQKTDVTVVYKTGQTYTLKNVSSVSTVPNRVVIGVTKWVDEGIRLEVNQIIDTALVKSIEIRTPTGAMSLAAYGDGEFMVDFPNGFSIARQWSQVF